MDMEEDAAAQLPPPAAPAAAEPSQVSSRLYVCVWGVWGGGGMHRPTRLAMSSLLSVKVQGVER
jgi:hypothetical protein